MRWDLGLFIGFLRRIEIITGGSFCTHLVRSHHRAATHLNLLKPLYQKYLQIASAIKEYNDFVILLWHNPDFNVKIFLINAKTLQNAF